MYIYKTTNLINGKIYVGLSTKTVEEGTKYYGSGKLINKAIKQYGLENFTKEILTRDIEDKKQLAKLEVEFIKEYNSTDRNIGYNISAGGDLNPDSQRVAIYKYKISGELLKSYSTIEDAVKETGDKNLYRKNVRESRPLKGYWYSTSPLSKDEVVQKQLDFESVRKESFKEAAAKRHANPKLAQFYKNNMAKARAAVNNFETTEETKQKISKSLTGRRWYHNPEDHSQNGQYHEAPSGWVRGRGKNYMK